MVGYQFILLFDNLNKSQMKVLAKNVIVALNMIKQMFMQKLFSTIAEKIRGGNPIPCT